MKKISADYIFPVTTPPIKDGVLIVDNNGIIVDIKENTNDDCVKYSGIIVPGFINTHCHLELSHLKNKIVCNNGLKDFLPQINKYRNSFTIEQQTDSIKNADRDMLLEGIVAVGDIANSTISFDIKKNSDILYHTFVEVYAIDPLQNNDKIKLTRDNAHQLSEMKLPHSIVPHAPYSVNKKLFQWILSQQNEATICCIHNQETYSENQLFANGNGLLYDMFTSFGFDLSEFAAQGTTALQYLMEILPRKQPFLFVHNTFTSDPELQTILANFDDSYWALCPSSNLYIEKQLPNATMFANSGAVVTLGTDSLASNTQLSIIEEMKVITKNFPYILFDDVLRWATLNGAKALQIDKQLGSLTKGKAPGLVLIDNFDSNNFCLTPKSNATLLQKALKKNL